MSRKKRKQADGDAVAGRAPDPLEGGIRLSRHPRAARHIRTAKSWGGLVAFALAGWFSHRAGLPAADTALRAILGGIGGYLAVWLIAVVVWRQIALAELEDLRVKLVALAAERERAEAEAEQEAEAAKAAAEAEYASRREAEAAAKADAA